mgnify:CR=1 FL=1
MKVVEEYMKSMIYPELKDESDKVILHSVMEQFANQIVIEELEDILDMIQCSENLDSLREHITSKIELKQER